MWAGVEPERSPFDGAGDSRSWRRTKGGGPFPVTASALRDLPLAKLIAAQRAGLAPKVLGRLSRASAEPAPAPTPRRGRPRKYDTAHFEAVAVVYSEAWRRGAPPRRAVADSFEVSEAVAGQWVRRCREMGALPPTSPGRAGGEIAAATKDASRRTKR